MWYSSGVRKVIAGTRVVEMEGCWGSDFGSNLKEELPDLLMAQMQKHERKESRIKLRF